MKDWYLKIVDGMVSMCIRVLGGYRYVIAALLFVAPPCLSQKIPLPDGKGIQITKIYTEETTNTIKLHASYEDVGLGEQLKADVARLRFSIKEGDELYEDVIFKTEKQSADHQMILTVSPPLEAAIYKAEKRQIILQLITENETYTDRKEVVLGSALGNFDLRPYMKTTLVKEYLRAAIVVCLLSIFLVLLVPIYQKYQFKKNHIKKYSDLKHEGDVHQDPFTFVIIGGNDKVVLMEDRIMLLKSWKRINKLPDSRPARELSEFFKARSEGSFFNPQSKNFIRINNAWYGLMGIFIGWLLFGALNALSNGWHSDLMSFIFDNDHFQVSTIIARDMVLGLVLGLCYSLSMALAEHFHSQESNKSFKEISIEVLIRTCIIAMAFFLQAIITGYLIGNPYMAGLISWILLGIGFTLPITLASNFKKKILLGSVVGAISFVLFQIANTGYAIELFGVALPSFFTLAILGSLSAFWAKAALVPSRAFNPAMEKLYRKVKNSTLAEEYFKNLERTGVQLGRALGGKKLGWQRKKNKEAVQAELDN